MRIKSDKNGEPKNTEPSVVAHECLCNCLVAEKLLMELLPSARCSFEIIWKNSHAAEILSALSIDTSDQPGNESRSKRCADDVMMKTISRTKFKQKMVVVLANHFTTIVDVLLL
jgi:hypothetical protein